MEMFASAAFKRLSRAVVKIPVRVSFLVVWETVLAKCLQRALKCYSKNDPLCAVISWERQFKCGKTKQVIYLENSNFSMLCRIELKGKKSHNLA